MACRSLEQAGVSAEEVNYVNAHATSKQVRFRNPKASRSTAYVLTTVLAGVHVPLYAARLEVFAAGKSPTGSVFTLCT